MCYLILGNHNFNPSKHLDPAWHARRFDSLFQLDSNVSMLTLGNQGIVREALRGGLQPAAVATALTLAPRFVEPSQDEGIEHERANDWISGEHDQLGSSSLDHCRCMCEKGCTYESMAPMNPGCMCMSMCMNCMCMSCMCMCMCVWVHVADQPTGACACARAIACAYACACACVSRCM